MHCHLHLSLQSSSLKAREVYFFIQFKQAVRLRAVALFALPIIRKHTIKFQLLRMPAQDDFFLVGEQISPQKTNELFELDLAAGPR